MKNLFDMDDKKYIAALGHELKINDKVEWITSGHTIIGKIIDFENDKVIVQTIGCRYKTEEELEIIKNKAKRQYKVAPHRLFQLVPKGYYNKKVAQ